MTIWTPVPKKPKLTLDTTIRKVCSNRIGDGYQVHGHDYPLTTSGLDIEINGSGRSGVMYESESSTRPAPTYFNDVMRNVRIRATPRYALTRWPRRGYGFEGICEVEDVIAQGFEEHWYDAPRSGKLTYRNVWLEAMGGNGLQLRLSDNKDDADWIKPKQIEVYNLCAIECGQKWGAGRAAFSGSFKTMGPNATLKLVDPFIQTVLQEQVAKGSDGKMKDSFGGPCFEFHRSVAVSGGVVEMKNPKNGLMQLYDMSEPDNDVCAPVSFSWVTPRSFMGGDIHVCEYTENMHFDAFDGPGEFVIHKRNASGVWKVTGKVPFTDGLSW